MLISAKKFEDGEGAQFYVSAQTRTEDTLLDACVTPQAYKESGKAKLSRNGATKYILTLPVTNGYFNLAIPGVLANEGGYVNDPDDPGGETNFGISKASYPNVDIKNLTKAEACAIYLRDFWLFGGLLSQAVANKLLDSYVNEKHDAIKIAQTIAGVVVDGSYGAHTEAAINALDPAFFLGKFRAGLASHYQDIVANNPKESAFLTDWLRRAEQ
jgi:hypothetical protein